MAFWTSDGIRVYTKQDWQGRAATGQLAPLGRLRTAVIHHGGPVGAPRYTKAAASRTCRDWQSYHMDHNGWLDIGYHFLIDGYGRIYLGRPADKLGAHVLNENTGRVGINFMQDGRYHGLTVGQKRTLRKLFKRRHGKLGLPALKDLARRPGDYGVLGHREVPDQATECPGNLILRDLHAIVKEFV